MLIRFSIGFILLVLLCLAHAKADPAAPTDEQVELAAIQGAVLACGAAITYGVQGLAVYCQVAKAAPPIEQKLQDAIKAQAKPPAK